MTPPVDVATGSDGATSAVGSHRIARRTLLVGVAGTAVVAVAARPGLAATDGHDGAPSAGSVPRAGAGGTLREVTLYAVVGPDNTLAYGTTPGNASIPGPTIEAIEGDTVRVTLVNTTAETVSLHAHGVDVPASDDGTPGSGSVVAPGQQHTYTWGTHPPTHRADGTWEPGSAGYWNYHDHAVGTVHGTGGIARGLYGALVVRRTGDPLPDVQNVVVFNEIAINNSPLPDTVNFEADLGQRVEWVMITHGVASFHTFHVHAHRWADNRLGLLAGPDDHAPIIDNRTTSPGESFGFMVIAGEHVGPGHWMYHCHVQFHADAGMVGLFVVNNADGSPPPGHEEHLAAHRAKAADLVAGGGHADHAAHAAAAAAAAAGDVVPAPTGHTAAAHAGHGG